MKRIIGVLLIGFLGFLGCSDGNDGTSTFTGEAIPVAPFGITDTTTPTFEWIPVPGATRYQILVEDGNEATVMEEWYTAEQGKCASEDGLCSVTPEIDVYGNIWKVLACAGENCGLWSDELQFSFRVAGPTPSRFTDNGDWTVMDNNTKLIWSRYADLGGLKNWYEAKRSCEEATYSGHSDWRLPSLPELKSLIDSSQFPTDHSQGRPFFNVQSAYWTSTTNVSDPTKAAAMTIINNRLLVIDGYKDSFRLYVWPVRSGN